MTRDANHLQSMATGLEALPAVLSVSAASQILGSGKNASYELIRQGRYARAHHWTRSTAAAVLIADGLGGKAEDGTQEEGDS